MTDQLTLTVDPLADAVYWDAHNPEAARYFVQVAKDDVARGIQPSSDFCGHMVRRSGLLTRKRAGGPVFNDHLTSQLARLYKKRFGIPFQTRESWAEKQVAS
jgi:hypothetical protein